MKNHTPTGAIVFGVLGVLFALINIFSAAGIIITSISLDSSLILQAMTEKGYNMSAVNSPTEIEQTLSFLRPIFLSIGGIILFLGILLLIFSIGLLCHKNWGRVGMIVMSILGILIAAGYFTLIISTLGDHFVYTSILVLIISLIVPVWQLIYLIKIKKLFVR